MILTFSLFAITHQPPGGQYCPAGYSIFRWLEIRNHYSPIHLGMTNCLSEKWSFPASFTLSPVNKINNVQSKAYYYTFAWSVLIVSTYQNGGSATLFSIEENQNTNKKIYFIIMWILDNHHHHASSEIIYISNTLTDSDIY